MTKQVRVAIFAILIILIFIVGLNFLKGKGFLNNNTEYYAIFEQVSGMNVSDPIVVNGYQVGKVGEMRLVNSGKNTGKIVAQLIIRDDVQVPLYSLATLFSADLLGEMNVKLLYADTSAFHKKGDTIRTKIEGSLFEELGGEITPLTDKLNLTIENVNRLFDFENKNQQTLNYTIENLNKTMSTFQETGELLNTQLEAQLLVIDRILKNVEQTTVMINSNEENINTSLANVTELTTNLKELDIQYTLNTVNTAVEEVNAAVAKLNDTNNTVGALLNERVMYDNLEQATKNLELLLEDVRVNPKRYVHFSVFGGKDKGDPVSE